MFEPAGAPARDRSPVAAHRARLRFSSLPISFPLDTVGIKAAIVAAQRPVRTQPRAERSDALDASGPKTSSRVARLDIRGQILSASLRLCVSALEATPFKRKDAKTQRRKASNRLALAAEQDAVGNE